MQKQEFEELIGRDVSDGDYAVIERVYQWHPVISNTSGKEEVAELYKSFGMVIFYDMLPRADKAFGLENQLYRAKAEVERIRAEMEELSRGNAPESVQVLPEALEEHLKMSERQRQRDREAIALARKSPGIWQQ